MPRPASPDPVVQRKLGLARSVWDEVDAAATSDGLSPLDWLRDAVFRKLAGSRPGPPGPQKAVSRPRKAADAILDPKTCPHPSNRRIGRGCGACGILKVPGAK